MLSYNNKISVRQLQILLILDIFGTGVTTLPRLVTEHAGQDGWICVILATVIMMAFAYLLSTAAKKLPNNSFVEAVCLLLTKPVGILISLFFAVKIIVNCALELRIFGEIVKQTILFKTPFAVICASMLLICGYAASKGIETRARLAEISIFIVMIPIIVIFGIAVVQVDFSNLLPVVKSTNAAEIGKGTLSALFAFKGIEFLLLVSSFLNQPKNAPKGAVQAIGITGALMTIITVITISRFGAFDTTHQMWPVINMMDAVGLPGSFIERQDALMISFWIVSIFAVVNASLFFSAIILKGVITRGRHSAYIMIVILCVFFISLLPTNIAEVYKWNTDINTIFGIALIIIPLLMIISAKIRGISNGTI